MDHNSQMLPRILRYLPEQEAKPGGFAVRGASVRVGERHAFLGQCIEVGRRVLVGRYFKVADLPVEVVSNHQQDVR